MSTAIEFSHVSKQYRLGLVSTKTLSHDIRRFWITNVLGKEDPYLKIGETNDRASKGTSEYVWALRDIDFKAEQSSSLVIIFNPFSKPHRLLFFVRGGQFVPYLEPVTICHQLPSFPQ